MPFTPIRDAIFFVALLLATALALPLAGATGAGSAPADPAAVIFNAPHLERTQGGQSLAYELKRAVSDPKMQGEGFTDKIVVDITGAAEIGTRDVVVKVFTGERARPPQAISGMTGNPLLVVFLDRAVNNLAQLAGGSRPFLKHKIKTSFVAAPQAVPVEITYKGRKLAGQSIRVTPFLGDKEVLKMMGYDGMSLEIIVSDEIPGHFVNLVSHYESPTPGSPRLDEAITLQGVEEIRVGGGK